VGVKKDANTFYGHVKELRRRLIWVILAIFASASLGYVFRDAIIKLLQNPLGSPLYYTSPAGSFNFIIKVSTIIGVFIAIPVIVYQLLKFVEPALPKKIKVKTMFGLIMFSFLLAIAGISFGFFVMIPTSLKFFASYSNSQIQPLISAEEYLNFVLNTLLFFAVVFQLPLITLFGNTIKPTKPKKLLKYQRHVIVGSLAIALILPFTYDPISQFVMALPIIVLYYVSIIALWLVNSRKDRKQRKLAIKAQKSPVRHAAKHEADTQDNIAEDTEESLKAHNQAVDGFVINMKRPTEADIKMHLAKKEAERLQRRSQLQKELESSAKSRPAIDGLGPVMRAV